MLKSTGSPTSRDTRRRTFLLSTLSTVILCSIAGTAHAGSCTGSAGIYTCSGVQNSGTDINQVLYGSPLLVTTAPGFGIVTSDIYAINLNGTDGLSFTDDNGSTITGERYGILASNKGSGSVYLTTTGAVTGRTGDGINVYNNDNLGTDLILQASEVFGGGTGITGVNNGSGMLSITTDGTVTGTTDYGIKAVNNSTGTDLTIRAADVFGTLGIYADNRGSGALSITSTGTATGTEGSGIFTINTGTDLTIQAADTFGLYFGINADNRGSGALSITSTGTATGTNAYGIDATNAGTDLTIEAADVFGEGAGINATNNGTGEMSITTTGTVTGTNGYGIFAENAGTNLSIQTTDVLGNYAINASNYGTGALSITSTGTVTGTGGPNRSGIYAINVGTDLSIQTTDVLGGSYGINASNYGTGALSITSTGMVKSTEDYDSKGFAGYGIYAINLGTDLTIQAADVSGNVGILAENRGAGVTSITTTGTVTGRGMQGIQAINTGLGPVSVEVNTGSTVQGALTGIDVNSTTPIDITNAGTVRNLSGSASDIAIQTSGAQGTLTNSGLLQGTVQLSDEGNRVINNAGGSWVTAGGTNEFGALTASNSLVNNGTLIAANGSVTDPVQTTTFNNVGTFTNASTGILNMDNGRAGDVTIINGDYVGNGGSLLLNTVLADDASVTDKLVVNGSTAGTTYVGVNNLGGSGAATLNGIELIQVSGVSDGEFVKNGRIVAGAYDYLLVRGADTNASNWYLTSVITPTPTPEPTPPTLLQRPEAGSYTANLAAVNNMFVTTLHDRLGETQYIDALTGEQKVTSLWLRNEGGHNRSRDTSGQLSTQANRYVVQLGGDIAQWSNNDRDRFHLGLMAGYGNSKSTTVSSLSGYNAKGSTDGYSTGIYGTWYANDADKSGLYVDSWAQYSWFNNTVDGQDLASEEYKSKGVTASVESGYTFKVGENAAKNATYFIQPKAQVTWMGVKADDHKEANGTNVSGEGDGNIQTRLGVKAFMKGYSDQDKGKDRVFQPFVEANWVHNTNDFGTTMDSVTVKQDGAANIAELKVGVEGQLNKQVNLWGNVGQQVGNKGYSDTAVMLGVKYNF
ncbi:autotransporter outer membrane beta-barrel domain-containing protein [Yersinia sp. 2545 StPb PI]|uniref:autotransporter outer membrane beta-barrel domain-containing protein n=1 Tax=Yersinia sp. 2545 StPb PI TaxID=3117410 RepID=UPI003FA4BE5D